MKTRYKFSILIPLLALLINACQRDTLEQTIEEPTAEEEPETLIKLGEKLENPYSVANMRKAYNSLTKKNKVANKSYIGKTFKDSTAIGTTDLYVKFWVENDEQKNLLLADSLNLSIIPLDVEIEQEGDHFVDENTELEQAQWLYTSVVKDYQFRPEVAYEKIEDLFLIEESGPEEEEGDEEEDENTTTTIAGRSNVSKSFLYDLEDEALRITDNWEEPEDEEDVQNGLSARRSKKKT